MPRLAPGAIGGVLALANLASPVGAEPARAWHAGLTLRTDLGAHFARLAGGVRRGGWDLTIVVDPLVLADDVHDLDLLLEPRLGGGWAALLGVRDTSIGLAGGRQFHDKLLVGVSGELPPLADGASRSPELLAAVRAEPRFASGLGGSVELALAGDLGVPPPLGAHSRPLADFGADLGLAAMGYHADYLGAAQLEALRSLDLDLAQWMNGTTAEALDAIGRDRPTYVLASEVPLVRRWLER